MSSEVLKKFGRYFLLDLIAQGGMAEIYRARLASKDGAGRLVVVKRIQAGFGTNEEFLKMFKSEIKVTMGLNHQNIVQVYDFGEEQQQPFIAMELVDGKNLRQLLNRFKELGQSFPVELAAHIIEQSAGGLNYAHTYKDKISGEHLNVVHRDISPQNLLVSFEGGVKIIDFGIAKATTNSEHTRAGVIKGKPSYLSPEQISGDSIDGRTDLFALGAVFWELLVGKKLFSGDNDLAVLKMIESCTSTVHPPSEFNPNVPKDLDAIVMKLLAKSPEKRFQTGEELQRTLRRFLNAYAPDFASGDLSNVAKEIFQKEIVEDRKKVQRLNDRVEQLLQNDIPEIAENAEEKGRKRDETTTFVARPSAGLPKAPVELKFDQTKGDVALSMERGPPANRPNASGLGRAVGNSAVHSSKPGARPSHMPNSSSVSMPNYATRTGMRGNYTSQRPIPESSSPLKGIAAVAALVVFASYAGPKWMDFEVPVVSGMLGWTVAVKEDPTLARAPAGVETPVVDSGTAIRPEEEAQTPPANLRLNIFPEGREGTISVNGKIVNPLNPVIQVPTNSLILLTILRPGFAEFKSEFKIDSRAVGENGEYLKEIALKVPNITRDPAAISGDKGFLTVKSTPGADTTIFVNGKYWRTIYAPFEMLPVPTGKISLQLYNSTLDLEDQISVEVEKNRSKQVQSSLKPKKR